MAVTTPDKEKKPDVKPVNIMDSGWAKNSSGYDKTPAQTGVPHGKAPAPTADQKQPSPAVASPQATTMPVQTQADITPVAAALQDPAYKTQAAIPPLDGAMNVEAVTHVPSVAASTPREALRPAFLASTNPPAFIAAQNAFAVIITPADAYALAEEARQHDDDLNPATIANGARALHIGATRANAGDKGRDDDKQSEKDRTEKVKNLSLYEISELYSTVYDRVQRNLQNLRQELSTIDSEIERRVALSASINSEIKTLQDERKALREEFQTMIVEKKEAAKTVHAAGAAHEQAKRDYEETKAKADPEKETSLKQQAVEENKDAIRLIYANAGVAREYDLIERSQKGDRSIGLREVENATATIKEKNLSADPQAALIKHLQETNPSHPYLQTADAKKTIMDQANTRLGHTQYDYMVKIDVVFNRRLEFLGNRITDIDSKIKNLEEQKEKNEEELAKLRETRERVAEALKKTEEYNKKLKDPEFKERLRKGDQDALKELEKIDSDSRYIGNALKGRGRQYDGKGLAYTREEPNAATAPVTAPQSTSPREPAASGYSRTTTDSAAGLVEGSKMAKMDGALKQPFTEAARQPTAPAAAPTAEADQTMTIAAAEQQRRPSAAGMSV